MIGQTLSHYRITAKLGEGGMGEVYRADDTTLEREVALKILPPELAGSQERLERFQREAKTLAALDHPNIVTIHTVEQAEGVHFLTMQLVEGKRLTELIPRSGMPLSRIFEIAIPLADALAAAHEKGIIHRDLKPGNVMVSDEGRVKVLDFGLAKLRWGPEEVGATELPTEPLTDEGRVLGTVPYMSPEQVEGKALDQRSDLFSLGVILYEMATGKRPFEGESPASVMSAILRDTPSAVTDVRDVLPRQLARIIRRCLVKEPERRFQTARELAIELEELRSEVTTGEAWGSVAPPTKRSRAAQWTGWGAAGIVLLAAVAVAAWILRLNQETAQERSEPATVSFTKLVFDTSDKGQVSASPDGRFFVYASDASGNWDIYLRRIGGGNAINLTGDSPAHDWQPTFAPDGESIAFRSERDSGGIFIMGATGEAVRRVADHGFSPAWSPDGGRIVFSTRSGLSRSSLDVEARIWAVDLASGDLEMVVDHSALMPAWSPDGRWIAYYGVSRSPETGSQYDLHAVSADGGAPIAISDDVHFEWSPAWSADGRSLYYRSDRGGSSDLWKVPIDEKTGRALADPEPITSGSNVAYVSSSGDGRRILYSTFVRSDEILRVPFDPVAQEVVGPSVSITPPGLGAKHPAVSPDGERVAFAAEFGHPGSLAIGVVQKDGSGLRKVTDSGHRDMLPDWSSDGQRLTFMSKRSGSVQAWIVNADGGGLRQLTDAPGMWFFGPKLSPDGSRVAAEVEDEAGGKGGYVFQVDPGSEEPPTPLPPFGEEGGGFFPYSWSPDGKLLAGVIRGPGVAEGATRIALYSFASRSYRVLTEPAAVCEVCANPNWFDGGRRVFFGNRLESDDFAFFVFDTESGEHHAVLTSEDLTGKEDGSAIMADISQDGRNIYVMWSSSESAIWMLTLGEQE